MEEEEGVKAEPLGASAGLGVAGGHGYSDDDSELRSVVCARGEQRRGWGPGGEDEGEGEREGVREARGVTGASRRKQEVARGSRRWPRPLGRAPRLASAYWQRKTTGGGVEMG